MRILSVILVFFFYLSDIAGQVDSVKTQKVDSSKAGNYIIPEVKRNGESLPEVQIKEVDVYPNRGFTKKRDYRKYERLVYNLKKVYPYSIIVREKLKQANDDLKNLNSDRERRKYIRKLEKDVLAQYEGDVREMTITQGRLLIKLIDRETRNTSYDLIKEYRGKLSAAFWQGIARIFGTNLKEQYDPYGEDFMIETIVEDIESGNL